MPEDRATRAKRSEVAKQVYAEARKEMHAERNMIPLDSARPDMKAPPGILTGKQWKERRGDKSDEECIDQICEFVAAGVYLKAAFRFVGVPPATWFRWRRGNKHQILDKYDFALSIGIMLRGEEILEIADAPIGDRRYDEDGNLVSASVGEEIAHRKVMINVRKWFLEAMSRRL